MPLDIAFGIYLAIAANSILDIPLTLFSVVLLILFTLSPDLDAIISAIKRGNLGDENHFHRNLMHYPLIFTPAGAVLTVVILGKEYAILFVLASIFHFLHDSIGTGWGVRWLYPFSKKNYKLFYQVDTWKKEARKLIYAWSPEELKAVMKKYHNPNWLKEIYLQGHPIGIFEYISLVVALILLVLFL